MNLPWPNSLRRLLQQQPQRALTVFAVGISLLLCALVVNDLQRDYAQQFAAAEAQTGSLSQVLVEHARQSMRRVELSMSLAAQEVQTQEQSPGTLSPDVGERMRRHLLPDGLIVSFAVLDTSGRIVASSLTNAVAELPLANDRDFYLAHQGAMQTDLFVGAAVKSRISGLWIMPVSMKLSGGYKGILMAAVDPEYFQRLYQSIDTGDQGFVTLFTTQGWAVARWPFNSEITEDNWLESPLFKQHLLRADEGFVRRESVTNGPPSVFSYRVLPEYPLAVVLGTSMDGVLERWWQRLLLEGVGLLLVLLVLGGYTRVLLAELRRRQQAESALQLSEISVLKSSLPTYWIGADARILRVNQAACEQHGYTEAQMLRMSIPDLNPGMTLDEWPAHWERLRQTKFLHFETTHRHSQGHDIPVEVDLNFIEFEGREYNFAFIRDLSVRKQAQAAIERSAAMLRGAMDAVDEAFVLFDADDRLVYCNAKYAKLYPSMQEAVVPGARFEDLIRQGARLGLYRESAGREEAWIAERLRAHREGNEARIQHRDDGRVLRVIDRRTPDGNIVGIRVDITEMVRATEQAQEASRYKSQFLANMSHEIRTPMNAILGLLALLQRTELTPAQRDYTIKTEGAAQSLLGLLNDILDFSKVEAGKMELDPQPFRLDQMLRHVAVILSSNLGSKAIEVLFDIDAAVPAVVVADALRLQQVLVNLGTNAIKFTAQGQVVLRVRSQAVVAEGGVPQCRIEFAMQDSGIGIAPDKQAHIFTGFSQAEASTTRRFGGTGLGLAICKRMVELMGGTLALQSLPDVGSTFSFALQLPLPAPGEGLASLPQPRLSVAPKQVLLVDDNPVARNILANRIQAWQWPVEMADSGIQALARVQARAARGEPPFDVIYLDWRMPGMDGWELARALRDLETPTTARARIVMLSANGRDTPALRTAQEQALVDAFLFKPVTASELLDAALGLETLEARVRAHGRSSTRPLAGLRVLVVEDNLINQQVAEELLTADGALVSLAANGQLGVDAVAAADPPFDVVLLDIQMPVLDGYGATRKIRTELGLVDLPIVAMTANAMASDRQACLAAGMNDHVGKPFDMAHLVSVLLRVTGHSVPAFKGLDPTAPALLLPEPAPLEPALRAAPADAAAGKPSAYLDVDAALQRLSGMQSLYLDILKEYILSLDGVEAAYRQAAQAGDLQDLTVQMHSLKGTSATLGAMPLSAQSARLEKLFRNPPADVRALDHLPPLLETLQATHAAAQQAAAALQSQAGTPADLPDQAPGDAEAGHSAASGPAQRQTAQAFLTQLCMLLASSNLAALDMFEQRRNALDATPARFVADLQAALQVLDLAAAQQLAQAQMAELARVALLDASQYSQESKV